MSKIIVVGSSNTDMVVKTARFPAPGETILGGDFFMFPGGKGANQAVAAARLGGNVDFICCVGDDLFGKNALEGYRKDNIDVSHSLVAQGSPSGVALITIDDSGENEIVVASGANNLLSSEHIMDKSSVFDNANIVLTQLETPIATIASLSALCKEKGLSFIINPAPANTLSDAILDGLFLITPNETETKILTGMEVSDESSAKTAAKILLEKGIENVIITMGSKGAFFLNGEESFMVPASKVTAVDTTAAGDVFNGALAVCLSKNMGWHESIGFANKAAALSVTKMGAQASAPYQNEINKPI